MSRNTTPGRDTGPQPQPGVNNQRGYSMESDEGDVEDNRAASIASSRSNMSEQSVDAVSPAMSGQVEILEFQFPYKIHPLVLVLV